MNFLSIPPERGRRGKTTTCMKQSRSRISIFYQKYIQDASQKPLEKIQEAASPAGPWSNLLCETIEQLTKTPSQFYFKKC